MTAVAIGSGIRNELAVEMKKLIERHSLNIPDSTLINKNIFSGADTDDKRLSNFIEAVNSDRKIVWAMRGGYGATRLIASLSRLPRPNSSKTLIGFSDITAMNIFVSQRWPNWRVIHAPVLAHLGKEDYSKDKFETLLNVLENKIDSYEISGVFPLNYRARTQKNVVGKLTGGNLSIIECSLKTCWEIQTNGKILFIEDVYESPERIYRALHHLKESGKLTNIKALVFGDFHRTENKEKLRQYLKAFSNNLPVPVYITNQFGHDDHNMPLIYNATTELRDDKMIIHVTSIGPFISQLFRSPSSRRKFPLIVFLLQMSS
jgi:muramoyltetrapeptide carboxypeptidase